MKSPEAGEKKGLKRRDVLRLGLSGAAVVALGGISVLAARRSRPSGWVWQIDPEKCVQCASCAEHCVLHPSAVKCVHNYHLCGYCELCFGYFQPGAPALTSAAENQICPTGAIRRAFVEEPFYEYTIDEDLCIGCGKCVKGCNTFGNGSLFLQVRHDLCMNCNDCAIARRCPADAFRRIPADHPYLLKGAETETQKGSG
ncbi:MAG: 4Fe-4S binding protein [Planctomycetota bacterium]